MSDWTYQVLRPPLCILCNDLLSKAIYLVFHGIIHFNVFVMCAFLQRPGSGVKGPVFDDRLNIFTVPYAPSVHCSSLCSHETHLGLSTASPALRLRSASKRAFRASDASAKDIVNDASRVELTVG